MSTDHQSAQSTPDLLDPRAAHLRERLLVMAGFGLALIWTTYCLNGFRTPMTPIELSDLNAGSMLRQAVFGGSALVSGTLLLVTGRLWSTIRRDVYWWAFGALIISSTLFSDAPSLTIKRSVLYMCGLVTAGYIVTVLKGSLVRVVVLIGTLCACVGAMSLVWWVVFPSQITTNPGRPGLAGISNHPNTLAPAMSIGIILLTTVATETRKEQRLRIAGLLICLISLVMTGSITSMILCAVGVGAAQLSLWGGYLRGLTTMLLASTAGAVMIMGKAQVSESIFSSLNRDSTMSGRDVLWEIVRKEIDEFPIFGHGWGAFWYEGRGRDLVRTWNPRQSHNAYFDVVLDVGLVGMGVFALAMAASIVSLFRCMRYTKNKRARHAASGSLGVGIGLLCVYGLQQSFFGKPDSFAFAVLLWICLATRTQCKEVLSFSDSSA